MHSGSPNGNDADISKLVELARRVEAGEMKADEARANGDRVLEQRFAKASGLKAPSLRRVQMESLLFNYFDLRSVIHGAVANGLLFCLMCFVLGRESQWYLLSLAAGLALTLRWQRKESPRNIWRFAGIGAALFLAISLFVWLSEIGA